MTIATDPMFVALFGEMKGEKNKRIPIEFRETAETYPLVYNKQFYFYTRYATKDILRKDLLEFSMLHRHASKPRRNYISTVLQEFTE
jgi:hypothetical protein